MDIDMICAVVILMICVSSATYLIGRIYGYKEGHDTWIRISNEHDAIVRAEAIEEFVAFANTMPTVEGDDGEIRPMWLEEMAEHLKEQK